MKLLFSLFLINLFLFTPHAMAKKEYGNTKRTYTKTKKVKPQRTYKKYPSLEKASKHLELRDKVEKQNKSKSTEKKIVKKFEKFLKKLSGQILIEEVDNGKNDILKLRLVDKKNKYQVINVYHRLESLYSERRVTKTYLEGEQTYAEINISEVPVGSFEAYFRFEAIKIKKSKKKEEKDKKSKKEKFKEFLGHATFEKTQSAFAIFTVDHNPNEGFAYIDTSTSYSEAGNIVEYIYRVYTNGKLIKEETKNYPSNYLTFNEIGTNEIELEVVDSAGNRNVSDRQTINIVNSAPTIKYTLTPRDGLVGHYTFDFSGTIDNDGDEQLSYRIFLNYEVDGVVKRALTKNSDNPIIHFAAPAAGVEYTLSFMATDSTGQYDYRRIPFIHNGNIAPKYEWHYIAPDEKIVTYRYLGAEFSSKDGIATYHYKATHDDGTVVYPWGEDNELDRGLELTKVGNWTIEFYAIDSTGLKSEVITEAINVAWEETDLVPVALWCYDVVAEWDPRILGLGCGFHDPLGEVVEFEYRATHTDGTQIYGVYDKSVLDNELRFPQKGTWTIEATATDNDGNKTIETWSLNVDWEGRLPITELSLGGDGFYNYWVVENKSFPEEIVRSFYTVTHESGERIVGEGLGWGFGVTLFKRGEWIFEYKVEDTLGFVSDPVTETVSIEELVVKATLTQSSENLREYSMSFDGSYDPIDPLRDVNFRIKAIHESGESFEIYHYSGIAILNFPKSGTWTVEAYGIDTPFGIESGYFSQTIEVVNLKPIASATFGPGKSWNSFVLDASESKDEDGEVVSYLYSFTHESGTVFSHSSEKYLEEVTFPKLPGTWSYSLVVTDNEGGLSSPFVGSVEVSAPPLELSFELYPSNSSPYAYTVNASETNFMGKAEMGIKVFKEGTLLFESNFLSLVTDIGVFNTSGVYVVEVSVTDGDQNDMDSKTLSISLPNVDGDTIPLDPGDSGLATLLGTDSDKDGVRDDIEIWINNISNVTNYQKTFLKEMSKKLQDQLKSNTKDESVNATFRELAYEYCLESKLGREVASDLSSKLRANFFNTKDRLMAWADGQINFAGQAVVLDTDKNNYQNYCN